MKRIILGIIALTFVVGVFAQKDKKATKILDAVIAKTESHKTIEVEFTLTMKNPEAGIDESKSGIIQIMGDSYRLDMGEMLVISDGETMWNLLLEDEEVMINEVEEDDADAITPSNLLNSYSDNYKSKFVKEDISNGKTVEIIELTPLKGRNFTKIRVIIDKAKKQILSFTSFDKNGSTYSYIFNKYVINKEIPLAAFSFNEADYPDFEIIDMR